MLETLAHSPGPQTEFASHNLNIITNELIKIFPFTFCFIDGCINKIFIPGITLAIVINQTAVQLIMLCS